MDEARLAVESGAVLVLVAEEAGELRPGGDVWVAGVKAGRITDIRFVGAESRSPNLVIRAVLDRAPARALRRDARATIEPSGLLAPFVVDIDPGGAGAPPYDFGDTLTARLSVTMREVEKFTDSLRIVADELRPIASRLAESLHEAEGPIAGLSRSGQEFREVLADFSELDRLNARSGALGKLLTDTALASRLRRTREQLSVLESRASERLRVRLGSRFETLAASLESLQDHLSAARGSAGRALHDREIENQVRLFRARADTVRAELASTPFRWLRVRLF